MKLKKNFNDEIKLDDIFKTILKGKKKIIIILIISVLFAFSININQPDPTIKATTIIKPLKKNQLNIFDYFNSLGIYQINESVLFDNYLNALLERTVLKSSIQKFRIISKENYQNNEEYKKALLLESYKIKVKNYNDYYNRNASDNKTLPTIQLEDTNKDKLIEMINYIKDENHKPSIQNLKKGFKNRLKTLKLIDEEKKKKIQNQIKNVNEDFDIQLEKQLQKLNFKIEDVTIAIKNSYDDYKLKNINSLQYLKEQASIARTLDIAKYTQGDIANYTQGLDNEGRIYFLGYLAIEKEIKVLENRKKKEHFLSNENLQKTLRGLKQDKRLARKEKNKLYLDGIIDKKKQIRDIDQQHILYERAEILFEETIKKIQSNFETVDFEIRNTKFETEPQTSFSKRLLLAIIFGTIISMIYIIIEEKIKNS